MKIHASVLRALVLFGSLGLCASAAAEPRRDDRHDDQRGRRDDHRDRRDQQAAPAPSIPVAEAPAAPGAVAPAAPDPQLTQRLREAEQQRERDRRNGQKDSRAWNDGRSQRAATHRQQLSSTWGSLVNNPDAKAELATHADRMARLHRILDIANEKGDTALAARAQADIDAEIARDSQVMQSIRAKAGAQ
ncbi:MAG TPA: hypothetical protein VGI10_29540 [Polyangiaceae bacterium]|jgi:hypothetical protein